MPKKTEILEKARQLFIEQGYRSGMQNVNSPEDSELLEGGFYNQAMSELMRNNHKSEIESEFIAYPNEFSVDIAEAMKSGVFCSGTTGTGKSDILMFVANQLMKKEILVVVFDGSQDWQNRSSIPHVQKGSYIAEIPQNNIVYDLSSVSVRTQQQTIEDFCRKIMQYQAEHHTQKFFIIFEEAHTYFPEGCMRARRYENTVRMMTQGRNFGIRFACITQFASLIDKNAMRYMRQRYFGYTVEPNDLEYIQKFFSKEQTQTIAEKLKSLDVGSFIYLNGDKTQLIHIEPFESNIHREQILSKIPHVEPLTLEKPKHDTSKAIATLITAFLWFIAILYAISAR